jgi:hypothetical protein
MDVNNCTPAGGVAENIVDCVPVAHSIVLDSLEEVQEADEVIKAKCELYRLAEQNYKTRISKRRIHTSVCVNCAEQNIYIDISSCDDLDIPPVINFTHVEGDPEGEDIIFSGVDTYSRRARKVNNLGTDFASRRQSWIQECHRISTLDKCFPILCKSCCDMLEVEDVPISVSESEQFEDEKEQESEDFRQSICANCKTVSTHDLGDSSAWGNEVGEAGIYGQYGSIIDNSIMYWMEDDMPGHLTIGDDICNECLKDLYDRGLLDDGKDFDTGKAMQVGLYFQMHSIDNNNNFNNLNIQ